MSRLLKRVPMDFSWPKEKVWRGYINPYAKLMVDCSACVYAKHGPRGYSPQAYRFHQEWYGYVEFDPLAYGATPIQRDHPRIREFAAMQVNRHPDFYMTPMEFQQESAHKVARLVILDGERDERRLHVINSYRGPAIEREITRLHEVCINNHWCHHLSQADVDALVAAERLMDFTHRPRNQEQVEMLKVQEAAGESSYWLKEPNGYHPTADEVNEWALFGMGHDAINQGVCLRARCEREGVAVECPNCGGEGYHWAAVDYNDLPYLTEGLLRTDTLLAIKPVGTNNVSASALKQLHEEWQDYEPPQGPGFQLWENCSEGSPVSAVFASLEELCEHCEKHQSTFGTGNFVSKERWHQMLDANFVYHQESNAQGDTHIFM